METGNTGPFFVCLASATFDCCGVFLEGMEFRKSAELAWNIRVQDKENRGHFVADVWQWQWFVVDEEIDCRVNYGFTSKRGFDASQVQEWKSLKRVAIEASHMNSFGAEWSASSWGKPVSPHKG